MRGIRAGVLAVGAAALLSTQAAYGASTVPSGVTIDPLVSVSFFGTGASRAAVCAGSTAAVSAAATSAALAPAPGCVLPVTAPPPPPPAPVAAVIPPPPPPAGGGIGILPILLGLVALGALVAVLASGSGNGNGNITPISPA
jgi:hypothetical protein